MVLNEPTGYEGEPCEVFEELPPKLYSLLYHYERLNQDLPSELSYYRRRLGDRCKKVLDLGCGTGLLSANLNKHGFTLTSIDIDSEMLQQAKKRAAGRLALMDMCALGLSPGFEAAIIAQNTLNLILDEQKIQHCLEEIRRVLAAPGLILAHLHCSEPEHRHSSRNQLLQFQLFGHPQGGKIIKETIRSFDAEKNALKLEQRYKIRRFNKAHPDRNYRTLIYLAALSRKRWVEIFEATGFAVESTFSDFSDNPNHHGPTLHLTGRIHQP